MQTLSCASVPARRPSSSAGAWRSARGMSVVKSRGRPVVAEMTGLGVVRPGLGAPGKWSLCPRASFQSALSRH